MNKGKLLTKIACWIGYCLFAGYSALMTAKSVSMTYQMKYFWLVFIFVFVVALIAGFCLSAMVGEIQNRINPNKGKFIICLIGFLLFWGVSFMTNVHYMLMKDEGLKVVSAEFGNYKSYVEDATRSKKEEIKGKEEIDIALCEATIQNLTDEFKRECESSIRYGFGDRAISYLKDIENYFTNSGGKFGDTYNYKNSIFDDEKDRGDRGKTGAKQVMALKEKYSIRIAEKLLRRENVIKNYYKKQIDLIKDLTLMQEFINDSLYLVDLPQITKIATPDVYYQFQSVQLNTNIFNRLDKNEQIEVERSTKVSKTDDPQDIEKGKFRYRIYPSSRMFSTWNVWEDMFAGRLPKDMKLLGMILLSLIIDIVAYVLRIFAR